MLNKHVRTLTKGEHIGIFLFVALLAFLALLAGCSDSGTNPENEQVGHLAGSGRSNDTDDFSGGPADSGPNDSLLNQSYPDLPQQYYPLFTFCVTCEELANHQIIDDQTDWEESLNVIVDCLSELSAYDELSKDSLLSAYLSMDVDFADYVLALIKFSSANCGRDRIDIIGLSTSVDGTEITYLVLSPGDECVTPGNGSDTVETIAVFEIPSPIEEPVSWIREDSTYNCTWQPDPDRPIMLYYTDADCELGSGEQIISQDSDWEAWLETAYNCDYERWGGWADTVYADCTLVVPGPIEYTIPIDFSKYAVIILRADPQTRWGGGIWLDELNVTSEGTEIDYSVMVPAEDCPEVEEYLGVLQPTAAIRVPGNLTEPITWNRRIEEISCDWTDTTEVVTDPDSVNRKSVIEGF